MRWQRATRPFLAVSILQTGQARHPKVGTRKIPVNYPRGRVMNAAKFRRRSGHLERAETRKTSAPARTRARVFCMRRNWPQTAARRPKTPVGRDWPTWPKSAAPMRPVRRRLRQSGRCESNCRRSRKRGRIDARGVKTEIGPTLRGHVSKRT